jgi:hypothetical protein
MTKKRKPTSVRFKVWGYRDFPIDMLRHDSCWPATPEDSLTIMLSFAHRATAAAPFAVELRSASESVIEKGPTDAYWRSFRWAFMPGSVREEYDS